MDRGSNRRRRSWPHVRAILIAIHLLALAALSLPPPGIVADRGRWRSPRGRMELISWTETLNGLGIEITSSELEAKAWKWAQAYTRWHRRWVGPFHRYATYAHTWQGWSMFTHPKKRVGRIWVEIDEGSGYRPVYVTRSATYQWQIGALTHNRMRKLFNRVTSHRYPAGFDEFARWIARRAATDFPAAHHCRVRIENYDTPTPAQARAGIEPPSEFSRTRIVELDAIRASK